MYDFCFVTIHKMPDYIYSLVHPIAFCDGRKHEQKIGATHSPKSRNVGHNTSHLFPTNYKWVLKVNRSCYYVESLIHAHYKHQHRYYGAGTEFYDGDITLDDIKKFLDENFINYEEIDVNNLPDDEKSDVLFDNVLKLYRKYANYQMTTSDVILKDIEKRLTSIITKYKKVLRDYQIECVEIFKKLLLGGYFQGLYFLATGLGKSVIMWEMCEEHFKNHPDENIMIVTFRKDIYESIKKNFDNNKVISFIGNSYDKEKVKNARGKVIVILRSSLIKADLPNNKIHGVMYDESHDGATEDISTHKALLEMNTTQKGLRYRLGFSATPLTDTNDQNKGVIDLYGNNGKVNYLYSYGMLKGIQNNYLCKFSVDFLNVESNDGSIKDFFNSTTENSTDHIKNNKNIYDDILTKIKKGLKYSRYKKGIIWVPTIDCVNSFELYLKDKLTNVSVYKSHSDYNKDDDTFCNSEKNSIMIACDKFATGFDSKNLDVGFNFFTNEGGHKTIQKIGRFLRPKDKYDVDDQIHFYQLCENDEKNNKSVLLGSLIKNIIGIDNEQLKDKIIQQTKKHIENKEVKLLEFNEFDVDIKDVQFDFEKFKNEVEKELGLVKNKDLQIIRDIIKKENDNRKQENKGIIDNIKEYNSFAKLKNLSSMDELEQKYGDINLTWLFCLENEKYLGWLELCEIARKYDTTNKKLSDCYNELLKQYNIPKDPKNVYKKFTNLKDLFGNELDLFFV